MNRRTILSGLIAGLSARWSWGHPKAPTDPLLLSATDRVSLMRSRQLGVVEHAQLVIAQSERWQALNAFIAWDPQRVLDEARRVERQKDRGGALYGLPIPVKDSINTAQYATTVGTPALRHFRPADDAPIVARLRAAGAYVLGKTNLHELSYGWTSNNLAFGAVHNPYDLSRIPGGSSGGSAAAVAARIAPLAVAEDTEGSIRVPAALCGLAGFRPSTGRYSTEGAAPISALFDQVGPVATHARDLLLFDEVCATGSHGGITPSSLAGIRLAVLRREHWSDLHPDVEAVANAGLRRLQEHGAIIVETDCPELPALVAAIVEPIQNHDVRVALSAYLKQFGAPVSFDQVVAEASADIRDVFTQVVLPGSPGFVTEPEYRNMVDVLRPKLQQVYADLFQRTMTDAIVFPTTRVTAPVIGNDEAVDIGGRSIDFTRAIAGNISGGSTAGLPGLVLPAGLDPNGLPVALEFDGKAGSDRHLLAFAVALEAALGRIAPPPAPK
jgi:mandelamide amidase